MTRHKPKDANKGWQERMMRRLQNANTRAARRHAGTEAAVNIERPDWQEDVIAEERARSVDRHSRRDVDAVDNVDPGADAEDSTPRLTFNNRG